GNLWQPEINRVDGACLTANPTTAEVLQWAANKWVINPILLYSVATEESSWSQAGVGNNGTSSGLFQLADRVGHTMPSLDSLKPAKISQERTAVSMPTLCGLVVFILCRHRRQSWRRCWCCAAIVVRRLGDWRWAICQ